MAASRKVLEKVLCRDSAERLAERGLHAREILKSLRRLRKYRPGGREEETQRNSSLGEFLPWSSTL